MAGYLKQQINCSRLKKKQQIKKSLFVFEEVVSTTPSQANGNHATELSTIDHVNSELRWKSTFDFPQTVNNYGLKRRIFCHSLRFLSHFSLKLHIQFWKNFHSVFLCSAGSDYFKKSRLLDFFGQVASALLKQQNNVWNLLKVNDKDTRTTSLKLILLSSYVKTFIWFQSK